MFVKNIAEFVANLRGENLEELIEKTDANVKRIFKNQRNYIIINLPEGTYSHKSQTDVYRTSVIKLHISSPLHYVVII